MKLLLFMLLLPLTLIDLTGGSCRLRASVQTKDGPEGGEQTLHQTQLQLICDNVTCPETNFTNCDTYSELGIPPVCMKSGCSKVLNLCEESSSNSQDHTAPPCSMPERLTPVMNTSPTSMCASNTTVFQRITALSMRGKQSCTFTTTVTTTTAKVKKQKLTTTILTTTTQTSCSPSTFTNKTVTKWLKPTVSCNLISPTTNYVSTVTVRLPRQADTKLPTEKKICSSSASSALGALMGIFMVLLILVTTGWMWTCWSLKKRREIKINSLPNNYHNIPGRVNVNNESDTLRRLPNPLYEQTGTVAEPQTHHGEREGQETGPTYEIIPLPSIVDKRVKENGNNTGGDVSVEGASAKKSYDSTYSLVGREEEDATNFYPYSDGNNGKNGSLTTGNTYTDNHYHLLSDAQEKKMEGVREGLYKIPEKPEDDKDYEDPDEQERENVYYVLEGPTPERETEDIEDDNVQEVNEAAAYEVPMVSSTKNNTNV